MFLLLLAGALILSLNVAPAQAFNDRKCDQMVKKMLKEMKEFKRLKFKDAIAAVDQVDEDPDGLDSDELDMLNEALGPLEEKDWVINFIKLYNKMKKECMQ